MSFVFVIFHLIFCAHFSLEAKLGDARRQPHSNDFAVDSEQKVKNYLNETSGSGHFIKKSQVDELNRLKNQYMVRNFIDEFETQYAVSFQPDWTRVEKFDRPLKQSAEIRRQKWYYILENGNNTIFVKCLVSEMEKAGLNRTMFCEEIAESYLMLMDNCVVFESQSNLKESKNNSKIDCNPLQRRSVVVFLNSISGLKLDVGESKETVHLSKSLYKDLVQNDALHFDENRKLMQKAQRLNSDFWKLAKRAEDHFNVDFQNYFLG